MLVVDDQGTAHNYAAAALTMIMFLIKMLHIYLCMQGYQE